MLPHCAVDPGVENDKSEQGNECGEEEIHVLFVDLGRKQVEEVLRTKGTPERLVIILNKVNRCLARYSPRATTANQMSRQGLALNEQKCQFWAKFGRFGAKNPNFYGSK